MFDNYLNDEVQLFIANHSVKPIEKLALQKNPFPKLNWIFLLQQIEGKQKTISKLPFWHQTKGIIFPPKINLEQTSSQITAEYKAGLVSGASLIDLTGGFGVDAYFFSKKVEKVHHCEMNPTLSEMVVHNYKVLQTQNITCHIGNSSKIIADLEQSWDWIYLDPSRRHDVKGKVFLLSDCLPNVPELLPFYFQYSQKILIKTAPIFDLSAGIEQLKFIKKIHIVAVNNEVKELLWEIHQGYEDKITIATIDITPQKIIQFEFTWKDAYGPVNYSLPKKYLFEPNAALMKSNGFEAIASQYQVEKLHVHSHLYTADALFEFPGRTFEIIHSFLYQKKEMRLRLTDKKANITIRNFPESVASIRKKWNIKEGGDIYCFFTTDLKNRKIVLFCNKINDLL